MAGKMRKEELLARIRELEDRIRELQDAMKTSVEGGERFRSIIETMDEGFLEVDLKGRYTYVNEAMARAIGYPREEIIGMSYREIASPETAKYLQGLFYGVYRTGQPATVSDYEIVTKDGRKRFHELSVMLKRDERGDPSGFRAIGRDVTERRKTLEALRDSEEKYRAILENMEESYYEVDLQGNFTFFNEAMCRSLGYPREELMGMNYRSYETPETAKRAFEVYSEVFRTGRPRSIVDYELIRKDGRKIIVELSVGLRRDASGRPTGFCGVGRDVTERIRAEEALRQSEHRYRCFVENSFMGLFLCDFRTARFLQVNRRFCEMFGYSDDELLALTILDIIEPSEHQVLKQRSRQKRDGLLSESSSYVYTGIRKDGSRFRVNMNAAWVPYEGTQVMQGMAMDYSETERLETQLVQAQKLEAVGTLASGIAHDFNNLLMGILGNISLVMMDMPPGDAHRTRLESIEQYVRRGTDLTRQLLGFAHGGTYEVRVTDLRSFIEKSSEMFGRARKEICIHRSFDDGLWPVEVDQGQLEQVLLNLYVNAWHAMPGGGDLYLCANNVELQQDLETPYHVPAGRFVKVKVRDTGIGMDKATMGRIFEPFFTTRERGVGTGLGLASVYTIVRNHGGFLEVESTVNVGTTFAVYLPASQRRIHEDEQESGAPEHGEETILLVDDEQLVREVGENMLRSLGYKVICASGGGEAIELYARMRGRISLVILDMVMPGLAGDETFERLREINPAAKVLLASGYSLDGRAQDIMSRGCRGFIQKPFGVKEISRKIREILDSDA